VIVIAVVLFFGSLGLLPIVGTSFMSGMNEKMITINIQLPPNTDITATSATAAKVEALLKNNPVFKSYYTSIGTGNSMAGILSAAGGGGPNTASIEVYLKSDADLKKETEALSQNCLAIAGPEYVKVTNSESGDSMSAMGGGGIKLSIQGSNQEEVAKVTTLLMEKLKGVNGLANLSSDLTTVTPRLNITPDMGKAMASGLSIDQLTAMQQEYALLMVGSTLPGYTVKLENETYPVYIKSVTQSLTGVDQVKALKIGYPKVVSLGDLANIGFIEVPSHITHTDTALSATISAAVTQKDIGAVNQAVQKEIDSLPAHPGVEIKTAGIAEMMGDTFSRMGIAILIAIAIVFLIVILMMRSIRNPLMIMCSLPLASIGAFLALAIGRYTLSVSAMMGILMLVGIVLTNAIVLVTLVDHLRKGGMNTDEALIEGGKTRLRPILMTALTTIFAMVPMAVGISTGTMLTTELAVVVIGGMFSSTLLTLLVIPVIYSLVYRLKVKQSA
jgi:HAE1 family hydrophobic/amphiphilic exporter-1